MIRRIRDWPWVVKLGLLLVGAAIVPVCALTIYTDVVLRRELVARASARDVQRARNTAALIDAYFQDIVADVTLVALAPPTVSVLRDPGHPARAAELDLLLRNARQTKQLAELLALDYAGTVVAASNPRLVGANRITAPYFLSAIAGQVLADDPRYLPGEDQVYVHVSAPVRDARNRVVGVVAARVPLDKIDGLIAADTDAASTGEFGVLWDERGIVMSSPVMVERRFRPLGELRRFTRDRLIAEQRYGPETAALLAASSGGDALVQHSRWLAYDDLRDPVLRIDLGGGLMQVAAAPLRNRRWTYGIFVAESGVFAQADALGRRNLIVALAMALGAMVLALASARWLSRPLTEIGNAARALAAGDMTRRARLERRDEIGQMAEAFDAMADALARKDAELRQHADSLERRVAERTAELRGLLTAIPDLMFRMDRHGRLIDYVAAKESDLIVPPREFLGRHLSEVIPRDVAAVALTALERALKGEAVPPFEYTLGAGREARQYEARTSPSGFDSVVFIIRDVTARRLHEDRMRFLARTGSVLTSSLDYRSIVETLAQLPVPFVADLCIVDLLEHGMLWPAAVAASVPEIEGLVLAARRDEPVRTESDHPVAQALRGGPMLFDTLPQATFEQLTLGAGQVAAAGEVRPVSLMILPLVARGQTLGAMTLLSTTSGRRFGQPDLLLAQEFAHRAAFALDNARLYRDVQESSRMKDEFLGIVSHELRTPLNAVLGWAQVLRRSQQGDEQSRRAVEAIERNARAQAQLVEDLLDMSRAISGKIRLEPAATSVRGLVENTIDSFAPIARSRGLELSLAVDAAVGDIHGDPARLQQVLGNLLSNAVKFTPAGGVIQLSARAAGTHVEIRVTDSGSGIAPEFMPFIFDRFRQADSTTTRVHGGLGLGLAIARHLIELHGGTIRAESGGEGKGSTFIVLLPAGSSELPAPRSQGASIERAG